jgi:[ribosomal protein S5]-alanine N-acetyltransferase
VNAPHPAAGAPTARTPRLLLRPLRESDRDEFLRVHAVSLAFVAPWVPERFTTEPPEDLFRQELAKTELCVTAGPAASGCRLVAELIEPGHRGIAGYFNLNNLVRGVFQNADASWQLAADAAGRGLATEALGAMLDLAFAAPPLGLGLHRVQANVIPENHRSIALAQRCGFRREGLARAMLKIAGHWRDHYNFAKLAEEHTPTGAALERGP